MVNKENELVVFYKGEEWIFDPAWNYWFCGQGYPRGPLCGMPIEKGPPLPKVYILLFLECE